MQGACAGVCIFEAGRLLSQVPLSDLQENQELIEERAIGQVMDDSIFMTSHNLSCRSF